MHNKQDKDKINAISEIIDNQTAKYIWGGVDPDPSIVAKNFKANHARREKYALVCALLFIVPVLYTQLTSDQDVSRESAMALAGAVGMGVGTVAGNRRNRIIMSNETVRNRAAQILPLMEILKTRPWTSDEREKINGLSYLTVRGEPLGVSAMTKIALVEKMSELDMDYFASYKSGNLKYAPNWVRQYICSGFYGRGR